ncbi:extracellular solute-binding protein [Fodinicola acaciae]|uniref:extracellular solute-binding protein n=1 Tax=Fodinicola acaciae TaxID=2681555 RepID=UPI0013D7AACD|nr:extracellular solute-binding protein [Fodinicola acaciae]
MTASGTSTLTRPRQLGIGRRRLLAMAGASTAAMSVGACSRSNGRLAFWRPPVGELSWENLFFKDRVIPQYEHAKGKSPVDLLVIPWDSALTKYTAGFVGSQPPDVTYQIVPWMNRFRDSGALLDLAKAAGSGLDSYFAGVPDSIAEVVYGPKQQRYGLPISAGHFVLALNEAVWERAGRPALPTTYDEMIPFARKMTFDRAGRTMDQAGFDAKNIAVWGFGWPGVPGIQTNYVWNYLWSYGADIVSKNRRDIGFDNDAGRAALKHMKAMVDSGAATPMTLYSGTDGWDDLLVSGRVAMAWTEFLSTKQASRFPNARLKVIELPAGPAGKFVVGAAGYYAIAAKSRHQTEALDFIEYLLQPQLRREYIRGILSYPLTPVPDSYFDGLPDPRITAFLKAGAKQTRYSRLTPVLPYEPQEYLVGAFNDYLLGHVSLDTMIKQTSSQVKQMASAAHWPK